MYKVIDYITDLLYLHDCVIVPDFGAFICNSQSATIDEKSGIINPPSKYVVFNTNIKHNDGLLVDWVATKERIDYKKAQIKVSLFVEELKIRLNQRQKIAFGTLGVFSTDRKYNIIFEAQKTNFCSETLGMEQVDLSKATARKERITKQQELGISPSLSSVRNGLLQRILRFSFMIFVLVGAVIALTIALRKPVTDQTVEEPIMNTMSIQPSIEQVKSLLSNEDSYCSYIISPDNEYVIYDPALDLSQE